MILVVKLLRQIDSKMKYPSKIALSAHKLYDIMSEHLKVRNVQKMFL